MLLFISLIQTNMSTQHGQPHPLNPHLRPRRVPRSLRADEVLREPDYSAAESAHHPRSRPNQLRSQAPGDLRSEVRTGSGVIPPSRSRILWGSGNRALLARSLRDTGGLGGDHLPLKSERIHSVPAFSRPMKIEDPTAWDPQKFRIGGRRSGQDASIPRNAPRPRILRRKERCAFF